jgi:hypothetical protein
MILDAHTPSGRLAIRQQDRRSRVTAAALLTEALAEQRRIVLPAPRCRKVGAPQPRSWTATVLPARLRRMRRTSAGRRDESRTYTMSGCRAPAASTPLPKRGGGIGWSEAERPHPPRLPMSRLPGRGVRDLAVGAKRREHQRDPPVDLGQVMRSTEVPQVGDHVPALTQVLDDCRLARRAAAPRRRGEGR